MIRMSNNKSYPSPDLSQRERNNKICAQSQSERNLPKGWKKVKLEKAPILIIDGDRGRNYPKKDDFLKKGYCIFLNTKNVTSRGFDFSECNFITKEKDDTLRKGKLKRNDVVLTTRGTVGNVAYYNKNVPFEHIRINSGMVIIRPYGINADFNYQLFKFLKSKFSEFTSGSAQPQLPIRDLKQLEILLPPLPEQKAIASVLSSLDDKIDLLHRQNKTLEKMAETLFRQWFIEEAKDDWEEKPLKEIYVFEKGFEPGSKNYLEEKGSNTIRFIRVGDMLNSRGNVFIDKTLATKICEEDDLLVSFDGTVGRVIFGLEGAYSSGIRKIFSKNPLYNNLGLKFLIFNSKDIQELINSHATGTVILHASSSINYLTFSFPEENIIKKFNQIITPIFEKILKNKKQIRTLEQLRDTLLPKLMNGEARVKL